MKNCKDLSRYRELVPTKQKEMKAMEEELMQMEQSILMKYWLIMVMVLP